MATTTLTRTAETGAPSANRRNPLNAALAWVTFLLMAASLWAVFLYSSVEQVQGPPQKIFYFHVPLAWDAFLAFFLTLVGGIGYLRTRNARWDVLAYAAAEIGVVFTTLVIISGSIWGKTIWGTWWTWDARLTSTLVMWFVYVAYLMLRSSLGRTEKAARYSAVLGIVGFVDVPIVYESVNWWRTLHPQMVIEPNNVALPPDMLATFFLCLVTFTVFFIYMLRERMAVETLRHEIDELASGLEEVGV
ncbi:MAG TPA: cytochrome c biogenesis protein CcsA [Chloroflexota bacterium]|nr:cytochrome c biogenesis protein CcsA [Chloroflexota bacterium]